MDLGIHFYNGAKSYGISLIIEISLYWVEFVSRFNSLQNQRVRDLTVIYKYGQLDLHWGRQLAFFRLVKELQLTEEEWIELLENLGG